MAKTRELAKTQISYHYNLSNEFYQLFLDENMLYTCAYYRTGSEDLERAQRDKLDLICRKLRLQPGEKLLDIGCGWGGLTAWAAKHYGVIAHGITISEYQHEFAANLIKFQGLSDRCKVTITDYRDIQGEYDKMVSVGIIEHVGRNLPVFLESARNHLKEKGLFFNQTITVNANRKKGTPEIRFMDKYIFPGGLLDSVSSVLVQMERSGFEVLDVEGLRPHYVKTCKDWAEKLLANREKAIRLVGEEKYRAYLLYLTGCSYSFERGDIGLHQILLSRQTQAGLNSAPLTREDIYRKV